MVLTNQKKTVLIPVLTTILGFRDCTNPFKRNYGPSIFSIWEDRRIVYTRSSNPPGKDVCDVRTRNFRCADHEQYSIGRVACDVVNPHAAPSTNLQ